MFRPLILLAGTTALAVFIVTTPAVAGTQTATAVIYVAPGGHPVLSDGTAIRGWKPSTAPSWVQPRRRGHALDDVVT